MIGFKESLQYGLNILEALFSYFLSKIKLKKDPRFEK